MMIEDEELRAIYDFSCKERLRKLRDGLLRLEINPDDAMTSDVLRREIHSLKGDSRSVGLEPIALLSQQVESALRSIQCRETLLNSTIRDRLFYGLDVIEALVQEAVTGEVSTVDVEQAIAQLVELAPSPLPSPLPPPVVLSSEQPGSLELTVESTKAPLFIDDQELREVYQTTSLERLHKLEVGLLRLAMSPGDETTLAELLRQIHSLKGDSRSIGLDPIARIAQQVEAILKAIQRKEITTSSVSDRLYKGLAALEQLVHETATGEPSGVDLEQILSLLDVVIPKPLNLQPALVVEHNLRPELPLSSLLDDDQELREIYRATSEDRLLKLEASLSELAKSSNTAMVLETMRRQIHSLKGDSRSVGFNAVVVIAQQLEDIIKHLQRRELSFTFEVSDGLSQGLNVVRGLVYEAVAGKSSGVNVDQVLSQLIAVLEPSVLSRERATRLNLPSLAQIADVPDALPLEWTPLIDDEDLRELYRTTSEERLQRLEIGLLQLEHHPEDVAILTELMRETHSFKGDSRSIGVEAIEVLMHQVEEILGLIQQQVVVLTSEISDRLYLALDTVKQVLHHSVTGEPNAIDLDQVLAQLAINLPGDDESLPPPVALQPGSPSAAEGWIVDEELREIYRATSEERLQRLEEGLLRLERYPDDLSHLAELLREAHSLKGDARTVGVEAVEAISHQFEDVLGHIQRQTVKLTPEVGDRLYHSLDAMRQLVHTAVTGEPNVLNTSSVLSQLLEIVPASEIPKFESVPPAEPDRSSVLPADSSPAESSRTDTIRVPTRNLDDLLAQTEELTITKVQLAQTTEQVERVELVWQEWKANRRRDQALTSGFLNADPYEDRLEELISELKRSIEENNIKLERVAEELTDNVRTLRLLPLSTVFQTLPRMVRDLAKQQSKLVELIVEGGETLADKQLLEGIKDPLLHLIRNAIDHGIETTTERESLGKPAIAKIRLKGYQTTNSVVIEVSDDGRGLDSEQIKQTAIRRKLHTSDELEKMTTNQIYSLVMASGFSTRTFITEISGRGVGLDVVRTNVERLKGNVQIDSIPNQGCTFRLQLSTSLAISNVILLDIQGIIHAIPFEFLQTTLVVSPDQIELIEGREMIQLNDQLIPVANLIDVLELIQSPAYALANKVQYSRSERLSCVVLKVGDEQAGFFVDRLLDTQEVVLKPQSQILKRVRNVMGATTLGTGEICMILNPPDLIRTLQKPVQTAPESGLAESARRQSIILLVEDSLPVRTQEKRLLEKAGYEVVIAVDGLDGYNKLKTQKIDAVVSDVEMPNLDGLSLTAKIRRDKQYDELPIILVTTLSSEDDRRRGAEAGANAYIAKGKFNQEALLETLERLV